MRSLRIGTVPYLNVEPFVLALRELVPCEMVRRHPSSLLSLSRTGELDACMLSAVDLLDEEVEPLRGASISSDGAVKSVLLLSETRPSTWSHVALDSNSRTSNQLARILTETLFGGAKQYDSSSDPQLALQAGSCEAAVLIGDRALRAKENRYAFDLGSLWRDLTDLPFVYAAWTRGTRRTVTSETLEAILEEAHHTSGRFVNECVNRVSRQWCLEADRVRAYLHENISYGFGPREREGLREFGARLLRHGLTNDALVSSCVDHIRCGGNS